MSNRNKNNIYIPSNCDLVECMEIWRIKLGCTQRQEDIRYQLGGYGLHHCENPNPICHNIFFRGAVGALCIKCNKHYCNTCSFVYGKKITSIGFKTTIFNCHHCTFNYPDKTESNKEST